MREIRLRIEGMSCSHCVQTVQRALGAVPGVAAVDVSLSPPVAVVRIDEAVVQLEDLTRATEMAGYPSRIETP